MKVIVADKAGYCFGITNAMALADDTLKNAAHQPIYCLGDISHNRQEMERLEQMSKPPKCCPAADRPSRFTP